MQSVWPGTSLHPSVVLFGTRWSPQKTSVTIGSDIESPQTTGFKVKELHAGEPAQLPWKVKQVVAASNVHPSLALWGTAAPLQLSVIGMAIGVDGDKQPTETGSVGGAL